MSEFQLKNVQIRGKKRKGAWVSKFTGPVRLMRVQVKPGFSHKVCFQQRGLEMACSCAPPCLIWMAGKSMTECEDGLKEGGMGWS